MRFVHARPSARFAAPTRRGKRPALFLTLALCCALLTGCATLDAIAPSAETGSAGPNLGLLSLPAYEDQEAQEPEATDAGAGYANVDLWLDATQNMGGISTTSSSMYPHYGHKYREGGFHYHYGSTTGWYESLLRDFLAAAGETHMRTLRYGNETMSDAFLAESGLDAADASVFRDLHTCRVETSASLFHQLSDEDMADSFYDLGSKNWLNGLSALSAGELENPALYEAMNAALNTQTQAIAGGDESFILQQGKNGEQCALLSALANIDVHKLSVITVDPASVRKTAGADAQGQPISYYTELLAETGVFEKGLCVGVLDFQLDYLGQLSTVSTAELSEPLAWGHVILKGGNVSANTAGVLPRRMLTLVIGTSERVESYIDSLSLILEGDASLQGLRGIENDELAYTVDGQTVVQQPFGFEWNATVIARPGVGYYSQHTQGAELTAQDDNGNASQVDAGENGVALAQLMPDDTGKQPDRTITVRFPLDAAGEGAALDVSALGGAGLETVDTMLLSQTLSNTAENLAAAEAAGEEAVAYRDRLYLFSRAQDDGGAFTLAGIAQEDGALVCTVQVNGDALKPGYYRLRLTADSTGDQVVWDSVPWIDGSQSVSASVTDADVYAWETFTAAITKYDRDAKGLPKMFRNAWGPATDELYHGLTVPDCPPVYRSIHLKELVDQFRSAAAAEENALIRYVFEVFVAYP